MSLRVCGSTLQQLEVCKSNSQLIQAAELAEDMTRIQGLYLGYWLQNRLRI